PASLHICTGMWVRHPVRYELSCTWISRGRLLSSPSLQNNPPRRKTASMTIPTCALCCGTRGERQLPSGRSCVARGALAAHPDCGRHGTESHFDNRSDSAVRNRGRSYTTSSRVLSGARPRWCRAHTERAAHRDTIERESVRFCDCRLRHSCH